MGVRLMVAINCVRTGAVWFSSCKISGLGFDEQNGTVQTISYAAHLVADLFIENHYTSLWLCCFDPVQSKYTSARRSLTASFEFDIFHGQLILRV